MAAMVWKKSSRSAQASNCVETAALSGAALIRDSKLGEESAVLELRPTAFARFIGAVKSGRFGG